MGASKNMMVWIGAILAIVGILAIAIPAFTTEETKEVAKIGDLKLEAKEETTHVIPPFLGPAALVIGVVLIGAGVIARR